MVLKRLVATLSQNALAFVSTLAQPSSMTSAKSASRVHFGAAAGLATAPSSEDLHHVLQNVFGLREFKPGQENVIRRLMAGERMIVISPTASGKSLLYQMLAYLKRDQGLTVVISPYLALMHDQVRNINKVIPNSAVTLSSIQSPYEKTEIMRDILMGEHYMLYVAPEQLELASTNQLIKLRGVSSVIVDEAHLVNDTFFRPAYGKIEEAVSSWGSKVNLCTTATLEPGMLETLQENFGIRKYVAKNPYRGNLKLIVTEVQGQSIDDVLIKRLKSRPPGRVMVFFDDRRGTERVAKKLIKAGFPSARQYHAGMLKADRIEVQEFFLEKDDAIVVATGSFGTGINVKDVRYVYHYDPAFGKTDFVQKSGRAGRDGKDAIIEVLYTRKRNKKISYLIKKDVKEELYKIIIRQVLDSIFDVSSNALSLLGSAAIVADNIVSHLLSDGFLKYSRSVSHMENKNGMKKRARFGMTVDRDGRDSSSASLTVFFSRDTQETTRYFIVNKTRDWLEVLTRKLEKLFEENTMSQLDRFAELERAIQSSECYPKNIFSEFVGYDKEEDWRCGNCSNCLNLKPKE